MMSYPQTFDNKRATRRKMAVGCYRALLFQVLILLPVALMLVIAGETGLADVVQSVGVWAGGLNLALGGIIGTYSVQATKDDEHRRTILHTNKAGESQ